MKTLWFSILVQPPCDASEPLTFEILIAKHNENDMFWTPRNISKISKFQQISKMIPPHSTWQVARQLVPCQLVPDGMPTGAMPTGAMPTGAIPTGVMPTGATWQVACQLVPCQLLPGGMPTGSMPSGMPFGTSWHGTSWRASCHVEGRIISEVFEILNFLIF